MDVLHHRERAAGNSCDATSTVAPSPAACCAFAAGSAAAKYGIQYDGTSAGTISGMSMQPATEVPPSWNSV